MNFGTIVIKNTVCALLVMLLFISCSPDVAEINSEKNNIDYDYVKKTLGGDPGFGIETTGKGPIYLPMAYALVALASSNKGDLEYSVRAADWLIQNSSDKEPGWGLGWEWDAFSNGVINPANTVYGITTAIAVDGLVSTLKNTKEIRYLQAAEDALIYYLQFQCPTSGHFKYSNQVSDAAYDVPNITAMLMGQYMRLGEILNNSVFKAAAAKSYDAIVKDAVYREGSVHWIYASGVEKERENDLVHASYIVYGLHLYESYSSKHVDLAPTATRYLYGFIADDIYEFNTEIVPPPGGG